MDPTPLIPIERITAYQQCLDMTRAEAIAFMQLETLDEIARLLGALLARDNEENT